MDQFGILAMVNFGEFKKLNSHILLYIKMWNAAMDETELPCKREIGNAHDPYTVAIKKVTPTGNVTVGQTPRVLSSVCLVFIHHGGTKCV